MRPTRWMFVTVAGAVALVGCSGSGSGDDAEPIVVGTVAPAPQSTPTVARTAAPIEFDSTEPLRVTVSVEVDSAGVDAELAATVDPGDLDGIDPFGEFASCSGGRRAFGPYSVLVSQPGGELSSVSVLTSASVTGPRVYDADVRVELVSGDAVTAIGTVTIGDDLRSGEFLAFEAGGERVEGSFVCAGGDAEPGVLGAADTDGVLDSVEVVALLRSNGRERIVGLAVDTARAPDVAAECAAAVGAAGPLLVRVDGGPSVGAITTFELTDGGAPTMRLRVGGTTYAFDAVSITTLETAAAGTFSAVADGVSVDGAFRCA